MNALATILAGLIVLSVPFLWWLSRKANGQYAHDLGEIRTLLDERSQSVKDLHERFDKLGVDTLVKVESAESTKAQSHRSYLYTVSPLSTIDRLGYTPFNYWQHNAVQEYLNNLHSTSSQDWWKNIQAPEANTTPFTFWPRQSPVRTRRIAWNDFQSGDPRRVQSQVMSKTRPELVQLYPLRPFLRGRHI